MPADILGTNMVMETADGKRFFEFQRGPIFTQICLADEINRATPKTQSAMLETMQEGSVTVAGKRYQLVQPFFVMATQNPIEQEGTYPLPEAQLDRFFFKLMVGYSDRDATGHDRRSDHPRRDDRAGQGDGRPGDSPLARAGPRSDPGRARAGLHRAADAGHASARRRSPRRSPTSTSAGASVRGRRRRWRWPSKVRALLDARYNVSFEDVRRVYLPALRHRILLNFEAQAEGIEPDHVLLELLEKVPEKAE